MKVKDAKEEVADIKVKQNDLSETVEIEVRRISLTAISDGGVTDKEQAGDTATFKVRTDAPLSTIIEMMDSIQDGCGGGHLFFQGKLMNDLDLTIEKTQAGNKALFMLASQEGGFSGGKFKKWWRFTNKCTNSTWYWSDNTDSVCFCPRRDIIWMGIGIHSSRNNEDLKVQCRWMFGDPDNIEQDWTEATLIHEERDTEFNCHEVPLSKFGVKPIKVKAGTKIFFCNKSGMGRTHVNYGDGGNQYEQVQDQEVDFDVYDSKWDNNCTNTSRGMFPFIMYK